MHFLLFDWNPTTGIDVVGNFKIHFYSMTWIVAFALGHVIVSYIYKRENEKSEYLDPLFIYMILSTMIGARLGHVLFYQPELITQDPLSIILPFKFAGGFRFSGFQGLASHGATIGIIVGMYLYRRKYKYKSLIWILDRMVLPVASGAGFIRFGNFINSEIIGKVTDSTFGIRFIQDHYRRYEIADLTGIKNVKAAYASVTENPKMAHLLEAIPYRHPAQLYEAICYVFVFIILWSIYMKTTKKDQPGFLFGLFLILLWTVRFFVEFVKEPQGEEFINWFGFNTGQWLSIPFILLGLFFMFIYQPKNTITNA